MTAHLRSQRTLQTTTAFMMGKEFSSLKKVWEQADFDQDVWKIKLMFCSDEVEVLS